MSFFARLRSSVFTKSMSTKAQSPVRTRLSRSRCMPQLESLEDRTQPSTLTVTNLHDSGAGSLRAAITAASNGTTIDFAKGLHGTITLISGDLPIANSVTIDGPGANLLTISGNDSSRIFDVSGSATVDISGLTLSDGLANVGGGILLEGSASLSANNCAMSNDEALGNAAGGGFGGAIERCELHLQLR